MRGTLRISSAVRSFVSLSLRAILSSHVLFFRRITMYNDVRRVGSAVQITYRRDRSFSNLTSFASECDEEVWEEEEAWQEASGDSGTTMRWEIYHLH